MLKNIQKYFHIAFASYKQSVGNKAMLIGISILLMLLLLTYNQLWIMIGSQENSVLNTSFIWYLLFAEIIILSPTRMDRVFNDDIESGTMTYFVSKPISFFGMRFFEGVGEMTSSFLALLLFGGLITFLITDGIPFKLIHLPIIILVCYISCLINLFLKSAIGLSALWINNTRYLAMLIERLAFIFGGAIFPLSIYPDWFVNIAKFTPFYSFYYLTIKLVYDFSWKNLVVAMSLNAMWFAIIGIFIHLAYKTLSKKVEVYGG